MKRLSRDGTNANGFPVLHDDFVDFGVALQVQILMDCPRGVDVGMGRVASTSGLFELSVSILIR